MRRVAPITPYIAVAVGLYGIHSAWAALGIYHAGMLATVLASGSPKPERGRLSIRTVWIVVAACLFALGGVATYILWPYLNHGESTIAERLARCGIDRHNWPYLAVYFSVVNSVLEELFWRGALGSDGLRPVGNDLFFGGYHAFVLLAFADPIWSMPVFVACAFAGWLWRMLRAATGGLALPIVTHIIADVSIAAAVHLRVFA